MSHTAHVGVSPANPTRAVLVPTAALAVLLAAALLARQGLGDALAPHPAVQAWCTTVLSMSLQALPFLVLGVLLSSAITVLVPPTLLERALPKNPYAAVPVAGTAGFLLPGCECASVPVSAALIRGGVAPAAALAFQLAAPAVNPVVLASTAVAFGGNWHMVGARFLASWLTAIIAGWAWIHMGKSTPLNLRTRHEHAHGRWHALVEELGHDVLMAGGYLVLGAAIAATMSVVVPTEWIQTVASQPMLSVLVLALLAVVVAVCSEADAFVAAGLTGFSPTAQLAFLVVGPVVDVKLITMQIGTYGRAMAASFVPFSFAAALLCATWVAWWLL